MSWQVEAQQIPLRGSECESDTAKVAVPISLLRQANIKLIEREYYIKLNEKKDTIIKLKDEQINILNEEVLVKSKRANLFGITTGISLIGLIIIILIK